ncbi:ATP-dependent dethiobiotin synthetase BioD [Terrilactibacillus laevilacticus]|uniref:ATP-dependent dethiobiotin synthetase BioD n=1 Tax=Terrilactibacillus laevilacticus TaxID=1380157 RepID=A0ABW5PRJ3_9BACI|nr:dethiobiotin synthase [Terrilactibacillus laevilacticus]
MQQYDIVLVEGAGGLAVPLFERTKGFYMTKDFIIDCKLPAVFISPSGLGSIHNVMTTYTYAKLHQLDVKTILFNHFNENNQIHRDNIDTIEKLTGLAALLRIPTFTNVKTDLRVYVSNLLKNDDYIQRLKEVF